MGSATTGSGEARGGPATIASPRIRIDQWTACGAGRETRADWIAWARGTTIAGETARPSVILPTTLRRRVTDLGQMAFRAATSLTVPPSARFIFCSRHGEFRRTLGILTALATDEPVSPAEFSLSVHNALAGLLSIAWHNPAGHTTIAAGADSFRSGLLEAAACLLESREQPILLVYFDDRLPSPYDEIVDNDETCVALAMVLTAPRDGVDEMILELTPRVGSEVESASGQALAFIRCLLTDRVATAGLESAADGWRRG